jgi:hypothetical protein
MPRAAAFRATRGAPFFTRQPRSNDRLRHRANRRSAIIAAAGFGDGLADLLGRLFLSSRLRRFCEVSGRRSRFAAAGGALRPGPAANLRYGMHAYQPANPQKTSLGGAAGQSRQRLVVAFPVSGKRHDAGSSNSPCVAGFLVTRFSRLRRETPMDVARRTAAPKSAALGPQDLTRAH